jgi:hypothetical protein
MDFARRAARNEEILRGVNRQIEEGAELHGVTTPMPFHCECAKTPCLEKVELAPHLYDRILSSRYQFVVVPTHVEPAVERVVEQHDHFVVVEKIGEARAEIDQDHPQRLHAEDPEHGTYVSSPPER